MRRRTLATLPVTSLQLVMVNVLELDFLIDVELLDFGGAQSISRTSHCTFDLGNLRILNCTYSRVLSLSFPSEILKFLRGIFHEGRQLVEIHLQIVCRFLRRLVCGFDENCVEELQLVRVDVLRFQPYNGVLLPSFRSCCSSTPSLGNHLSVLHEHCLLC